MSFYLVLDVLDLLHDFALFTLLNCAVVISEPLFELHLWLREPQQAIWFVPHVNVKTTSSQRGLRKGLLVEVKEVFAAGHFLVHAADVLYFDRD